jgi:formylglycine-generating enzyme required for sulfatase activity
MRIHTLGRPGLLHLINRSIHVLPRLGEAGAAGIVCPSLAEQIGVKLKKIEGGPYIYQGEKAIIEPFEAQETPFTIGMMNELLKIKQEEVKACFNDPESEKPAEALIEEMLTQSYKTIAQGVPEEQRVNCPLLYVSRREARMIANLLGLRLLPDCEWERLASGKTGQLYPWGNERIDKTRAVYRGSHEFAGTRPVRSKPAGASAEGIHDLIGLVLEWVEEDLRGGSWYHDASCGQLEAQFNVYALGRDRANYVGFRLARSIGAPIPAAPTQW